MVVHRRGRRPGKGNSSLLKMDGLEAGHGKRYRKQPDQYVRVILKNNQNKSTVGFAGSSERAANRTKAHEQLTEPDISERLSYRGRWLGSVA